MKPSKYQQNQVIKESFKVVKFMTTHQIDYELKLIEILKFVPRF